MNPDQFNQAIPGPDDQPPEPRLDQSTAGALGPDVRELIAQYGFPVYRKKLNEPFWAAYYRAQQIELLFEPNEGEFYRYHKESGLFVSVSVDSIREELAALVLKASRDWANMGPLAENRSEINLKGVLVHLRGQTLQYNPFNNSGRIIHLANCILCLGEDGSFTTESFSPKFKSRHRSPITYEPAATCPLFEKALLAQLEEDDRELLQKYAGQCLLGHNLTQKIVILDGVSNASKSAFLLVVRAIVGSTNTYELRTKHLAERFEIGRMIGKTLLLGADVKAEFLQQEGASRLKSLVGGDLLEAERKGSNKVHPINGTFNVLLCSNSRLRVYLEGDHSAWRRRLAIVRYERPYEGKTIPDIQERLLEAEASGILNFFLEGVRKLFHDIREKGGIALSARQQKRVDSLLNESDSLRIFLRQNLASTAKADLSVDEILSAYVRYALAAEWIPTPRTLAERQLPDLMLELFGTPKSNDIKRNGKNQRGFSKIRFRQDDEQD